MSKTIFCALFLCVVFAFGGSLTIFGQTGEKSTATEKRVKFERGKTSKILTGKIADRNDGVIYLVNVGGNQKLSVTIISVSGDFEMYIVAPDTQEALLTGKNKSWSATMTKMGDVEITFGGKRDNFSYKIKISVVDGGDPAGNTN